MIRTHGLVKRAVARAVDCLVVPELQDAYFQVNPNEARASARKFVAAIAAQRDPTDVNEGWRFLTELYKIATTVKGQTIAQIGKCIPALPHHELRLYSLRPKDVSAAASDRIANYVHWIKARIIVDNSGDRTAPPVVKLFQLAEFAASLGATVDQSGVRLNKRKVTNVAPQAVEQTITMLKGIWNEALLRDLYAKVSSSPDVGGPPVPADVHHVLNLRGEEDGPRLSAEFQTIEDDGTVRCTFILRIDPSLTVPARGIVAELDGREPLEYGELWTAINLSGGKDTPKFEIVAGNPGEAPDLIRLTFALPIAAASGKKSHEDHDRCPEITDMARSFDPALPPYVQVSVSSTNAPLLVESSLLLQPHIAYHLVRALRFANDNPLVKNMIVYAFDPSDLPRVAINVENVEAALSADDVYHARCVEIMAEGDLDRAASESNYLFHGAVCVPLHQLAEPDVARALVELMEVARDGISADLAAFTPYGSGAFKRFVTGVKQGLGRIEEGCGLPLSKVTLEVPDVDSYGLGPIPFHVRPAISTRLIQGVFYRREDGLDIVRLNLTKGQFSVPDDILDVLYTIAYSDVTADDSIVGGEPEDGVKNVKIALAHDLRAWLLGLKESATLPRDDFRRALAIWMFDNLHEVYDFDGLRGVVSMKPEPKTKVNGDSKGEEQSDA